MLKSYLKIAFRNLLKYKNFTILNIFGLAVGMASALLIFMWVLNELSYDRFHVHADKIYRLVAEANHIRYAISHAPFGKILKDECPEVVSSTRTLLLNNECTIECDNRIFVRELRQVTPDFFEVFSFPFCTGDRETALASPNGVVITRDVAETCFGDIDPTGESLVIDGQDFKITAVLQNIPRNSHIEFDILKPAEWSTEWGDWSYFTYILVHDNRSVDELVTKMNAIYRRVKPEATAEYFLQPLTDIHLDSGFKFDVKSNRDIHYLYMFSIVALFILVIACFNFINLTTTRLANRTREAGIRIVVGSGFGQLIQQILTETALLIILAFILALIFVEISLPFFNIALAQHINLSLSDAKLISVILIMLVCTVVISGLYPALCISALQPIRVLKDRSVSTLRGKGFRRTLVIIQFACSICLIAALLIVAKQLDYMRNSKLGFDRENLVYLRLRDDTRSILKTNLLKNELLKNPNIINASTCKSLPSQIMDGTTGARWEGGGENPNLQMAIFITDFDFLRTFDAQMVGGRFYSPDFKTDHTGSIILNETAVKAMQLLSPVGKQFIYDGQRQIIGVMRDIHFQSLKEEIEPVMIRLASDENPRERNYLVLRMKSNISDVENVVSFLEKAWRDVNPDYPFEFHFMDDHLDSIYASEQRLSHIFAYFTILAVFIACLGLFGLASFMTEKRTKEIGIRKAVGAGLKDILFLLVEDFTKWVLFANLIAWPVAWYAMNTWLQNFAYRIDLTIWPFLSAGLAALTIALLTVSWQTIRAATANPVNALRYE